MQIMARISKIIFIGAAFCVALTLSNSRAQADSLVVAGGCFWCVEADFESVKGVSEAVSGFAGGTVENPTYKQVTKGGTGHYEVVEITYDPAAAPLDSLLSKFFRSVDPTDAGGQFCDRGDSYRTAIFYADAAQKKAAEDAKADAEAALGKPIATPILPLTKFYPAEDYHQDYYKGDNLVLTRFGPRKQSKAYKLYREGCGRDDRVRQLWGSEAAFAK